MKVVVLIQARMGSTRLPGKVMLPLAGRPLLERLLERVGAAARVAEVCVITTDSVADDPIRALCVGLGVGVFSGHPTDLLDRHYRAGRALGADAVVKIPSDCPLIDPDVIDRVLARYYERSEELDFVTNLRPPTWPDGNDVEVISMAALEVAFREATDAFDREHTTPFLWRQPKRFRIANVTSPSGGDLSESHRFAIDYVEDYAVVRTVYEALYRPERPVFRTDEVVEFLAQRPVVRLLNARFHGKTYARGLERIAGAAPPSRQGG